MVRVGWSLLAAALSSALLAGCTEKGGGAGAGTCSAIRPTVEGPGDVRRLFPVAEGSTWTYRTTHDGPGPAQAPAHRQVRAGGAVTASGLAATRFTLRDLDDPSAPAQEALRAVGPSGVTLVPGSTASAPERAFGAYQLLRFPVTGGDRFVQLQCADVPVDDVDRDGTADRMDVHSEVTVVGEETVSVDAGTFTATRVETRVTVLLETSSSGSFAAETAETDWFAPGVGLVRSRTVGGDGAVDDEQLTGYAIAGGGEAGFVDAVVVSTGLAPADSNTGLAAAVSFDGTAHLVVGRLPDPSSSVYTRVRGWRIGPDLAAGAGFDLSDRRTLGRPAVAFGGTDQLVLATDYANASANDHPLAAQRVTPAGALVDGASGRDLVTGTSGLPHLASDGAGWAVAWVEYLGTGIRTEHVAPDGSATPGVFLGAPWSRWPSEPAVAGSAGGYLVAWAEDDTELRAVRLASDGAVLDADPIVVSSVLSEKLAAGIAWDGTQYLVVWLDARRGDRTAIGYTAFDVYAARVAPDGTVLDPGGFPVNALPGFTKNDPTVAATPHGFAVAWWLDGYSDPAGIYAARVTAAGAVVDDPAGRGVEVARPGSSARLVHPVVAPAAGGRTLVVYTENPEVSGATKSFRAARFAW